ncbi:hypothetical protein [Microbispora sp. GKU 823]|uniref:hypothetical protein n=2 Tax=Microbispora TaxID=2005 RepID=UPI0009A44A01|nr:hypothetical protein [Microbispora sp. GKU 823]OPG01277.1 hypothetical protein B1L11_44760 [Microbispora sp. GKU 823]
MAKSTSVAGILAIGAVLAGGAVIASAPLVAAPAGAATMSAQHGLVRFGHPHARGQRNRQKNAHRHNQRLREQQRQHQFLMRDLTLVLVPFQKETTDSAALPYNWQNDSVSALQHADQDQLAALQDTPETVEINRDGQEGDNKTTVSPQVDKRDVDRSVDVNKDEKKDEKKDGKQDRPAPRPSVDPGKRPVTVTPTATPTPAASNARPCAGLQPRREPVVSRS